MVPWPACEIRLHRSGAATIFAELAEEIGSDVADECALSFASGLEKGIVMAMIKPEWVQGFYLTLRGHYLTTHKAGQTRDIADESIRAF